MIRLSLLFASSLLLLSCSTVEVPNFKVYVTLPASGDGYGIETVTKKPYRIGAAKWEHQRKRGLTILPEDYKVLKKSIRKNCHTNKCKVMLGELDNLFFTIDKVLQQIPMEP